MAQTTINFSYKGKDYELKFTRATVKQLERNGLSLSKLEDQPLLQIEKLFAGSFIANHKSVKTDLVEEIFSKMPNKDQLLEKLIFMFEETQATLMEEPSDDEKLDWTVNG